MSRILVTGAQGFLGVRLVAFLKERHEVIACSHGDLDITNRVDVLEKFQHECPQYVVHCAAISDTGYSQQHPGESETVNVHGTVNVAMAAVAVGAKLIYMSSDQVYNHTLLLGGLQEDVSLSPNSVYGQHKLEAECQVGNIAPDAVGLRLTWMYDLLDSPYKLNRNILVNLHAASESGTVPLSIATREYRGITWVWDVIRRIESCFMLSGGVYNFGCENSANSYETFVAVAREMKLPHVEMLIQKDEQRFPEHPRNLSMDISRLRGHGIDFPDTLTGIRQALSHR